MTLWGREQTGEMGVEAGKIAVRTVTRGEGDLRNLRTEFLNSEEDTSL